MLRSLTIAVPVEDLAEMQETLRMLAAVKAEDSARRRRSGEADVAALDELLAQACPPIAPAAPVELTGPPGLVRDAAYGLLLDGVDSLAELCRAYEAGKASLRELVDAGRSAARRLALLRQIEEQDSWSSP